MLLSTKSNDDSNYYRENRLQWNYDKTSIHKVSSSQ